MDWNRFEDHGHSPDKAFEMICNQLFFNWVQKEYSDNFLYFNVVNGAGGDGGVESFTVLADGSIVGLQAKWFLNSIGDSQIKQIQKSVDTAVKIRPAIRRYIVCIPRDMSSITGRGSNTERKRWDELVASMKTQYPELQIDLWDDSSITAELAKVDTCGILRFWFKNTEISEECIRFAYEKAKQSWLSTKYLPDLNVPGEIYDYLSNMIGCYEQRNKQVMIIRQSIMLCNKCSAVTAELIEVSQTESGELRSLANDLLDYVESVRQILISTMSWLENDSNTELGIQNDIKNVDFSTFAHRIEITCDHYVSCFSHVYELRKVLKKLTSIDFYSLGKTLDIAQKVCDVIFLGDPGTGKTQAVGAFSQSTLDQELHVPILIRAQSVPSDLKWHEVIIQTLGLSKDWNEDELWQALIASANCNRFRENVLQSQIKITPKVIVIVDGIDESSDIDSWVSRIQETLAITQAYPQIRFCFTSRPAAIPVAKINITVKNMNPSGDIPVYALFDEYTKAYNVTVQNNGWIKYALSTPLALKFFCEIYQNCTVDIANRFEISIGELWHKKIAKVDSEFESKEHLLANSNYIFNSIVMLAEYYLEHKYIEQNELVKLLCNHFQLDTTITQKMIMHLVLCGALQSYQTKGTGREPNRCYFYPGIQSYFDYASAIAIIEKYKHPKKINFRLCKNISIDTLYALSIISIQRFGFLLTRNKSIRQVKDTWSINELQYISLLNTNYEIAHHFVSSLRRKMKQSAEMLVTITNKLVLPLSRDTGHPLGVSLLDGFLSSFTSPAQRDILWSVPSNLRDSTGKKWELRSPLNIGDTEYRLVQEDSASGLPIVYVWALSTVDNALRKYCRDSLMRWAQNNAIEYFTLLQKYSTVNDPQIKSELFAILLCVTFDSEDTIFIKQVTEWICQNILSPEKIDQERDISVRYYAIAIIRRAVILDILPKEDSIRYLPPYEVAESKICLNKAALKADRMNGFKAITYDLARYVLVDHLEHRFISYRAERNDRFNELIKQVANGNNTYSSITSEQFILSSAYAYLLNMGWNTKKFFRRRKQKKNGFTYDGVDVSISRSYSAATHGDQSRVMTFCEKYIWQARNAISGFLADRLPYGENDTHVVDYGLLDDFVIPEQEMAQFDPADFQDDKPLYIPEPVTVDIPKRNKSKSAVANTVMQAPDITWKEWLFVDNSTKQFSFLSDDLLALYGYLHFESYSGVESTLFISSIIIDINQVDAFIQQYRNVKDTRQRITAPLNWLGGIETSCYITPKEVCWFPWIERFDSDLLEEFPNINISSAVEECVYNYQDYGDVQYHLPSAPIRNLLNIIDTDGQHFWNNERESVLEYSVVGDSNGTTEHYLLANKDKLISVLAEAGKTIMWFLEDYRREGTNAREKFGDFFAERRIDFIGYIQDGNFIVEETQRSLSASDGLFQTDETIHDC